MQANTAQTVNPERERQRASYFLAGSGSTPLVAAQLRLGTSPTVPCCKALCEQLVGENTRRWKIFTLFSHCLKKHNEMIHNVLPFLSACLDFRSLRWIGLKSLPFKILHSFLTICFNNFCSQSLEFSPYWIGHLLWAIFSHFWDWWDHSWVDLFTRVSVLLDSSNLKNIISNKDFSIFFCYLLTLHMANVLH